MKRKIEEIEDQQDNNKTPPAKRPETEVPRAPVQEGVTLERFDVDALLPEGYEHADENDESDGRTSAEEISNDSDDGFDIDRLKLDPEFHHESKGIAASYHKSGASSYSEVGAFSGDSKARAKNLSSDDATTPSRESLKSSSLPKISKKSAASNEGVASTAPEELFEDFTNYCSPTPVRAPSQESSVRDPFSGISGKLGWFGEVEHTTSAALDEDLNSEYSATPVRTPKDEAVVGAGRASDYNAKELSPNTWRELEQDLTSPTGAGRASDYNAKELSPNTWKQLEEVLTSPAAKAGETVKESLKGYSIDQNVPDMDNLDMLHHGARLEAYMERSIENVLDAPGALNEVLEGFPAHYLPVLLVALDWWFESVL
jgi:hypothetical protein